VTLRMNLAVPVTALLLTALPVNDVLVAQEPESIFLSLVGTWRHTGTQRSTRIDALGRVWSYNGGLSGRVSAATVGGSNFGFFSEDMECYYDIALYADPLKTGWNLILQKLHTDAARAVGCPSTGEYAREPPVVEPAPSARLKKGQEVSAGPDDRDLDAVYAVLRREFGVELGKKYQPRDGAKEYRTESSTDHERWPKGTKYYNVSFKSGDDDTFLELGDPDRVVRSLIVQRNGHPNSLLKVFKRMLKDWGDAEDVVIEINPNLRTLCKGRPVDLIEASVPERTFRGFNYQYYSSSYRCEDVPIGAQDIETFSITRTIP
jgi:hypothetical protein